MLIAFVCVVYFLFIVWLFASRTLSPIPFYPTDARDVVSIIKIITDMKKSTIYDLGAGTGRIIFPLARRLAGKAQVVGVESNPILLVLLYVRKVFFLSPAHIWAKNLFEIDYTTFSSSSILYLYFTPQAIQEITPLLNKIPAGCFLISYRYRISQIGWKECVHTLPSGQKLFLYKK